MATYTFTALITHPDAECAAEAGEKRTLSVAGDDYNKVLAVADKWIAELEEGYPTQRIHRYDFRRED